MDQTGNINVDDISSAESVQVQELVEIMVETTTQDSPKPEEQQQLTPILQTEHFPTEEQVPKEDTPAADDANGKTFGEIKPAPLLLNVAQDFILPVSHSRLAEDLKIYPVSLSDLKIKPKQLRTTRKFVPEDQKDEKYYEYRRTNTAAVRRYRDAAYEKEKRLKLRLAFLEEECVRLQIENNLLHEIIENKDGELQKRKSLQH